MSETIDSEIMTTDEQQVESVFSRLLNRAGATTSKKQILDDMPVQEKWSWDLITDQKVAIPDKLIGLTNEQIKRILTGEDEPDIEASIDFDIRERQRHVYTELASSYWDCVTNNTREALASQQRPAKENLFLLSIETVLSEIGPLTEPERRIIASDTIAMYGICVTNGIDVLYDNYVETTRKAGGKVPENEDAALDIKVELVKGYLAEIHRKNKELEFAQATPVTYGMEVEFSDPIFTLAYLYSLDRTKLNTKQLAVAERLDKLPAWEKYKNSHNLLAQIQPFIPVVAAVATTSSERPSAHKLLQDEGATQEIAIKPTSTPRTALRELIMMKKMGGLGGKWSVHETIAGVDLSPVHTEIMDVTTISTAAGFLQWEKFTPEQIQRINSGELTIEERYPKTGFYGEQTSSEKLYFPLHKKRETNFSSPYTPKVDKAPAVERRSMPPFPDGTYANLVRDATFNYLAGWGINAIQKDEESRSDQERILSEAWTQLTTEWEQLLETVGLHNPPNEDRYFKVKKNANESEIKGKTEYEHFLTQIAAISQNNDEFRSAAKKIVQTYSRKVKAVIGY